MDEDFTCPRCGATSHHPMDAHEGYCGACHDWTGPDPYAGMGTSRRLMYDRQGKAITLREWCELMEDRGGNRVAHDVVVVGDEPVSVSTVWLGVDHSFDYREGHVPIIFETLAFAADRELDGIGERYATEAAALAGHDRIVAMLCDPTRWVQ